MTSLLELRDLPTLEEAIRQQISLGQRDPLDIARKMVDLYGSDWVAEQLAANWEEILAEIARQKLGNDRRAAITSLSEVRQAGGKVTKRDVVLTSTFIPGKGWVKTGDLTADDLLVRESYMRRLADGLNRHADWYAEVRGLLDAQGVQTVKQIKGQLPPLPGPELSA